MTENSILTLSEWYLSQCDGDWEHDHSIVFATLDNPGWSLDIDFSGTDLERRSFKTEERDIDATDWYRCWVEGTRFYGACSPQNVDKLAAVFVAWARQ